MSDETVLELWKQRDAWARAARDGTKRQRQVRLIGLSLAVLGALSGTVAGLVTVATLRVALAIASALLLGIGGYVARELLTPDRETKWARARVLAEALQRECYRYLMRVPPYDAPARGDELRSRTSTLLTNAGLDRRAIPRDGKTELPLVDDNIDSYINKRALKQANWYETHAEEHSHEQSWIHASTFGLGALAVALGVIGASWPTALAFVPFLTTVTAALVAWVQAYRVGTFVSIYQETATQLRLQVAAWRDGSQMRESTLTEERRQQTNAFVERCEDIMAKENGAWRAEWLNEERGKEVLAALQQVAREAEKATPSAKQPK